MDFCLLSVFSATFANPAGAAGAFSFAVRKTNAPLTGRALRDKTNSLQTRSFLYPRFFFLGGGGEGGWVLYLG